METYFDKRTGRNLTLRPDAFVYEGVFDVSYFNSLKDYLLNLRNNNRPLFIYDEGFGRLTYHTQNSGPDCMLRESLEKLVPLAKELFLDDTIEASYAIFSTYRGYKARLFEHVDDNACTYTIDVSIDHKDAWPLFVEGKEFTVDPNDAIIYYGEDQYHWRPDFPNPKTNEVSVIFYHFVPGNHWSKTIGQAHHSVIRKKEQEYRESLY